MDKLKRFEALLRKANLGESTVRYFSESFEDCLYFRRNEEEYYIDAGRLWGMLEMIQTLELLEKDDSVELLDLILDA